MVLTMASFPAFAEAGELSPSYLATDLTASDAQLTIGKIFEATENAGEWGTYFKSTNLAAGNGTTVLGNVVVGFEDKVNLSEIYFNMGGCNMKYGKLYGSNTTTDPTSTADWTELHTFDNLSYVQKNPSNASEGRTNTQTITHEGYYNYFKIEITGLSQAGGLTWLRSIFTGTAQESDAVALTPVGGKAAAGTGATITESSIAKLIDGDYSNYTQINAEPFDPTAGYAAEYVFEFDKEYAFDSFSSYWSSNYMTAAEVYVSSDGITWGDPVAVVANTGTIAVSKSGTTVYRSFIGFPEDQAVGKYIKLVVTDCKKAWCRIGEVEFTGAEPSTEEKVSATYTVKYQYTDGSEAAPDKVVTTKFVGDRVTESAIEIAGYAPDAETKTITSLVDGDTIVFIYTEKNTVPYTVKYVDGAGNPVADSKVVNDYVDGDAVTENAINLISKGYFIAENSLTKSLTIEDGATNEITFTYKKVIPVKSFSKTLLNSTAGIWNAGRMYNGEILGDYDQLDTTGSTGSPLVEMVFGFDGIYTLNTFTAYWGSSNADTVTIYVSEDGTNWGTPVYSGAVTDVKTDIVNNGATTSVYVSTFDLNGAKGQFVKYVVDTAASGWLAIREFTFEGTSALQNKIELTGDNVIDVKNFGWVGETITDGDPALLFDGAAATTAKAFAAYGYYNDSGIIDIINGTQPDGKPWGEVSFVIDLGSVYDLDYLILQGGAGNWGYTAPGEYDIYVAGVDKKFTLAKHETIVAIGGSVTNSAVKTTALDATNVRYVKIQLTAASRRTVLGEISVYGDEVDINTNPEAFAATLGGQIRLPEGNVTAGLRFGATIMKDLINEGDTYGMFMLPADMLGGSTLADYVLNDGEFALEVPAARLYAYDDYSVTFTAVLVEIPAGKYSQDIVAVPYICDAEGNYTFFAEKTRSYLTVATDVAKAYKQGEITLNETQIALIEGITGDTLVAPEVAE